MAEWKIRKYVPDSDDGEDDASSINTGSPTPRKDSTTNAEFLDIDDLAIERDYGGSTGDSTSKKGNVPRVGHVRAAKGKDYGKEQDTSRDIGTLALATTKPSKKGHHHYDDIDELQQDHYRASPTTQLFNEFLKDLQGDSLNLYRSSSAAEPTIWPNGPLSPLHQLTDTSPLSSPLTASPSPEIFLNDSANSRQQKERVNSINLVSPKLSLNHQLLSQKQILTENVINEGVVEAEAGRPGRSFRQRNPIQLHPYALEDERYRQSLKARGLKPLRITQAHTEGVEEGDVDSQEQDFNVEAESQPNEIPWNLVDVASSPPSQNSGNGSSQQPDSQWRIDEEDFPDIDTILGRHSPVAVHQGFKRRKVAHTYSRAGHKIIAKPQALPLEVADLSRHLHERQANDLDSVFDVPPSPPDTNGSSPLRDIVPAADGFRYPPGASFTQLHTPVTSSEPRKKQHVEIINVAGSEDDSPGEELDSENASSTSNPYSEDEEALDLQQVQRKIRGVLPASWTRLDLKTQKILPGRNTVADRSDGSPVSNEIQRGIARPVKKSNSNRLGRPRQQPAVNYMSNDSFSNDSSSDKGDVRRFRDAASAEEGIDNVAKDDVDLNFSLEFPDVTEDNSIDRMLPSNQRMTVSHTRSRYRQKKLSNEVIPVHNKKNYGLFRKHQANRKRQSSISNHIVRHRKAIENKPILRPPKVGILDVVLKKSTKANATPDFLRIASRTARVRSNAGRHSPSSKYLRLATLQDTRDVQETLSLWRAGSVRPRDLSPVRAPAGHRRPLAFASGNERRPPKSSGVSRQEYNNRRESLRERPKLRTRPGNSCLERRLRALHHSSLKLQTSGLNQSPSQKLPRSQKSKYRGIDRRNMLTSLQTVKPSRAAILESNVEGSDRVLAQDTLRRRLIQDIKVADKHSTRNSLLERFLGTSISIPLLKSQHHSVDTTNPKIATEEQVHYVNRTLSRRRKQPPRYLDTRTPPFRQYSEPPATQGASAQSPRENVTSFSENSVMQGLGAFGTKYSTSFNVIPLPTGFSFPKTTFVGGGHFSSSLVTPSRSFDVPSNTSNLNFNKSLFEWGSWTDVVSSQLGLVMERIDQILRDVHAQGSTRHRFPVEALETTYLQESIIHYIRENLNFLDPIDRNSCLQRCKALIKKLFDDRNDSPPESTYRPSKISGHPTMAENISILFFTRSLVMLHQLRHIAIHELVHSTLRDELRSLTIAVLRRTISLVLSNGFDYIRGFHQNCLYLDHAGWEDLYRIESIFVVYHIAKEDVKLLSTFWETVQISIMETTYGKLHDARVLDRMWHDLFVLLPLLELDANGAIKTGQRYEEPCENWGLVKLLIEPVLEAYLCNSSGQSPSFNVYFRAVLGRCLHLIKDWGWYKCEMIIGMFFDFYARNGLAHLQHEEFYGSPKFLENLNEDTVVEYSQRDRCFHILLKIIGTGLRGMRRVYPPKKIRDIAWRLMPNHGRSLLKDEAVRQQDLEALRNHHDLLCTLYWASPAGFRPRLSVIRNLVPFDSSHREACHISIRTWSNLVNYQISTKESLGSIEPFSEWYDDMIEQLLRQHELARTEMEVQANLVERMGDNMIPQNIRESTIARNQRQIEAVLSDALISLKIAVCATGCLDAARVLITESLPKVFDKFHAKQPRTNKIISEALDVVLAFTAKFMSLETNDDSQGFGDWSGLDQDMTPVEAESAAKHFQNIILDPLCRLMSNFFGADVVVEESFLLKLVQAWVSVGITSVNQGIKGWNDFLNPYGHESWKSLRDTEQTRKFTAYFLATLINEDRCVYQEHKYTILPLWIASILERESLLKFQNVLTEAVLNADRENPLLANLPFWVNPETGRFTISTIDFSERRLSLISSILSNMRESLDFCIYHSLAEKVTLKREYVALLKHIMTTMKNHYQELGHGSITTGAYVEFVQTVIGFLQQHTVEICPVDRFFIDSSAFPLPATDPTYVIGRLRNYKLRLQDAGTSKQLSVFIQAMSERAVVDNQQQYLVRQLHTAMANEYEVGHPAKLTLRSFLLRAIFPAYIEMSLSTSCGWLLATPILQAIEETFESIARDLDGTSKASVGAIEYSIAVFLDTVQRTFGLLVDHSGLLEKPTILQTLAQCYSSIGALLPTLSYISRLPFPADSALDSVKYLKSFANFAICVLSKHDDPYPPPDDEHEQFSLAQDDQLAGIRSFSTSELKETLAKNWVLHDQQYYSIKGNSRRRVIVHTGNFEEEKIRFLAEVGRFFDAIRTLSGFYEEDDLCGVSRKRRSSKTDDLVF